MLMNTGIIQVIQIDENGDRSARVDSPAPFYQGPGKYILAFNPGDLDAALGIPLFPVGLCRSQDKMEKPALGPIPSTWTPGTRFNFWGPLGRGFNPPANVQRLALAAFGGTTARLQPLISPAIQSKADIAIFSNEKNQKDHLPTAVEIHPLSSLAENLSWPSYLAIDIPLDQLPNLRSVLNLNPQDRIPIATQVLVQVPMPCSGIADCGACAVPTRKNSYKLACKDGPVFDINELDW
jgi:hypothetical protein